LRGALRADLENGRAAIILTHAIRTDVRYARVIFERNAGQIGDLRDPVLVGQLASFYTLLDRLEDFGRAAGTVTSDYRAYSRLLVSLASALHMATIVDMKLRTQTARFSPSNFKLKVTEQDAKDQQLATATIEEYGDQTEGADGPTR
jgi:hypothetical protein